MNVFSYLTFFSFVLCFYLPYKVLNIHIYTIQGEFKINTQKNVISGILAGFSGDRDYLPKVANCGFMSISGVLLNSTKTF